MQFYAAGVRLIEISLSASTSFDHQSSRADSIFIVLTHFLAERSPLLPGGKTLPTRRHRAQ